MCKKLKIFDFENGDNGLIEYLKTLSEFSRIEIQPLKYKFALNVVYIEIEFELVSIDKLKSEFPNIEIIIGEGVSIGECRMIVT